jgi:hypothetical protein
MPSASVTCPADLVSLYHAADDGCVRQHGDAVAQAGERR